MITHHVGQGKPINPWKSVLRMLHRLYTKYESLSEQPRIQKHAYELYTTTRSILHCLLERDWIMSFPVGSVICGIDERDVADLHKALAKRNNWDTVDWCVILTYLHNILTARGIEVPAL